MQNEYFKGWGGEDNEIMIRADLFNLNNIELTIHYIIFIIIGPKRELKIM